MVLASRQGLHLMEGKVLTGVRTSRQQRAACGEFIKDTVAFTRERDSIVGTGRRADETRGKERRPIRGWRKSTA